jgi:hypothetical protein
LKDVMFVHINMLVKRRDGGRELGERERMEEDGRRTGSGMRDRGPLRATGARERCATCVEATILDTPASMEAAC